jgi:CIC family chloride channel protein
VLSLFGSLLSIYFTLLVIKIKEIAIKINRAYIRLIIGSILIGAALFTFPFLYGDSYHGTIELIQTIADKNTVSLSLLVILIFSKPLVAALTLGAGGDGGVFAPSIVAGAVLGILFAQLSNQYFGTSLIPLNFALAGAAATLSPSIAAPFTTLILICNLVPNGYSLFIPIFICSIVGQKFARMILPYNVYSYTGRANGKPST